MSVRCCSAIILTVFALLPLDTSLCTCDVSSEQDDGSHQQDNMTVVGCLIDVELSCWLRRCMPTCHSFIDLLLHRGILILYFGTMNLFSGIAELKTPSSCIPCFMQNDNNNKTKKFKGNCVMFKCDLMTFIRSHVTNKV